MEALAFVAVDSTFVEVDTAAEQEERRNLGTSVDKSWVAAAAAGQLTDMSSTPLPPQALLAVAAEAGVGRGFGAVGMPAVADYVRILLLVETIAAVGELVVVDDVVVAPQVVSYLLRLNGP